MRTKALLLSAALVAAGVASSMAQSNVYSLNIVGYVNVPVPAGFSIVCNPLDDGLGDGNPISSVITSTNTPDGTLVYLYSPSQGFNNSEQYFQGFGWAPGTNQIPPGVGFFIQSAVATNITFVGQIAAGNYTNVLAGSSSFNLVGSIVPEAEMLGAPGIAGTLQIPANDGDNLYRYSQANFNGYDLISYFGGFGWADNTGTGTTNGPVINVGEGFFLQSTHGGNWVETFSVN